VWVHDELDKNSTRAHILSQLSEKSGFPMPIGVIRQISKSTYDNDFHDQINNIKNEKGKGDLKKLLFSGNMWEVN
jgi:2-oxoglutarate ferredoxin oxidoreductase subunit beta